MPHFISLYPSIWWQSLGTTAASTVGNYYPVLLPQQTTSGLQYNLALNNYAQAQQELALQAQRQNQIAQYQNYRYQNPNPITQYYSDRHPAPRPTIINADNRRHAEAVAIERRAADDRAAELLKSYLNDEQLADLARNGWFMVTGQSGRRYRIGVRRGYSGNVEVLADNDIRVVQRLCCHLDQPLPQADHFLAQKIMLENDEIGFLRLANRHPA